MCESCRARLTAAMGPRMSRATVRRVPTGDTLALCCKVGANRTSQTKKALHAAARPPRLALDRPRRLCRGNDRRGHRRRRNFAPRFGAGRGLCRSGGWPPRPPPARAILSADCCAAARWPSMGASDGLYMTHIIVFVFFGWFDKSMSAHWLGWNPRGGGLPARRDHGRRRRALVWLRIANPQAQALLFPPKYWSC